MSAVTAAGAALVTAAPTPAPNILLLVLETGWPHIVLAFAAFAAKQWLVKVGPFKTMQQSLNTAAGNSITLPRYQGAIGDYRRSGPAAARLLTWLKARALEERLNSELREFARNCAVIVMAYLTAIALLLGLLPNVAAENSQSALRNLLSFPAVELLLAFFHGVSTLGLMSEWGRLRSEIV